MQRQYQLTDIRHIPIRALREALLANNWLQDPEIIISIIRDTLNPEVITTVLAVADEGIEDGSLPADILEIALTTLADHHTNQFLIHHVAQYGTLSAFNICLKHNARLDLEEQETWLGGDTTVASRAALGNRVDILQRVMPIINIHAPAQDGMTPLHFLIRREMKVDTAKFLLRNGADVNAKNANDKTALFIILSRLGYQITSEELNKVILLLEYGAELAGISKGMIQAVHSMLNRDAKPENAVIKQYLLGLLLEKAALEELIKNPKTSRDLVLKNRIAMQVAEPYYLKAANLGNVPAGIKLFNHYMAVKQFDKAFQVFQTVDKFTQQKFSEILGIEKVIEFANELIAASEEELETKEANQKGEELLKLLMTQYWKKPVNVMSVQARLRLAEITARFPEYIPGMPLGDNLHNYMALQMTCNAYYQAVREKNPDLRDEAHKDILMRLTIYIDKKANAIEKGILAVTKYDPLKRDAKAVPIKYDHPGHFDCIIRFVNECSYTGQTKRAIEWMQLAASLPGLTDYFKGVYSFNVDSDEKENANTFIDTLINSQQKVHFHEGDTLEKIMCLRKASPVSLDRKAIAQASMAALDVKAPTAVAAPKPIASAAPVVPQVSPIKQIRDILAHKMLHLDAKEFSTLTAVGFHQNPYEKIKEPMKRLHDAITAVKGEVMTVAEAAHIREAAGRLLRLLPQEKMEKLSDLLKEIRQIEDLAKSAKP